MRSCGASTCLCVCVYFDMLVTSPGVSGLYYLITILAIFCIFNYLVLFINEAMSFRMMLRLPYIGINNVSRYVVGVTAYFMGACGLIINCRHGHSTFHSRCILAASSVVLFDMLFVHLMSVTGGWREGV